MNLKNSLDDMIRVTLVCLILFVPGCINSPSLENDDTFILATTTSLRDSGLLDYILEEFLIESQTNLKIVAFGTGAALNLGKKVMLMYSLFMPLKKKTNS